VTPGSALSASTPYTTYDWRWTPRQRRRAAGRPVDNQFHDRGSPMADGCGHRTGDVNNTKTRDCDQCRGDAVAVWLRAENQIRRIWFEPLQPRQRLGTALAITPDSESCPGSPIRDHRSRSMRTAMRLRCGHRVTAQRQVWAVVYIAAMGWGTPVSVEPMPTPARRASRSCRRSSLMPAACDRRVGAG